MRACVAAVAGNCPCAPKSSRMEQPPPAPEGASQAVTSNVAPKSRLDKLLAFVPRVLSSHAHIIFLGCLGVYLVLLPLFGVHVSSKSELIGGNYTNVTSDLGACIAAGLTVHLVKRDRRRGRELDEAFAKLHARYDDMVEKVERSAAAAERAEAAVTQGPGRD
jgi:hypothetical protein